MSPGEGSFREYLRDFEGLIGAVGGRVSCWGSELPSSSSFHFLEKRSGKRIFPFILTVILISPMMKM